MKVLVTFVACFGAFIVREGLALAKMIEELAL